MTSSLLNFLTSLVFVIFIPAGSQSMCCVREICCEEICKAPVPYNVSLEEIIAEQPLYVTLLPGIPLFAGVDSACYTFFPLPDGTYLFVFSILFTNGLSSISTYTLSSAETGVLSIGSGTCNTKNTIFEYIQTTNCNMYIGYICKYFGNCPLITGTDIPILAFSPVRKAISQDCYELAMNAISRAGEPSQNYFILPMKRTNACVTEMPCLDYSK